MKAANTYIRDLRGLGDFLGDDFTGSDVAATDPSYYSDTPASVAAAGPSDDQLSTSSSSTNYLDSLSTLAKAGAQVYTTAELISINATRAKQGLPPITASALAPTVNFGLSSDTLLIGGGVLLLVLMLSGSKH